MGRIAGVPNDMLNALGLDFGHARHDPYKRDSVREAQMKMRDAAWKNKWDIYCDRTGYSRNPEMLTTDMIVGATAHVEKETLINYALELLAMATPEQIVELNSAVGFTVVSPAEKELLDNVQSVIASSSVFRKRRNSEVLLDQSSQCGANVNSHICNAVHNSYQTQPVVRNEIKRKKVKGTRNELPVHHAETSDVRQCRKGHILSQGPLHIDTLTDESIVTCVGCGALDQPQFHHCQHCLYSLCEMCLGVRVIGEVPVPPEHVGLIIGRGGCNLQRLQKVVTTVVFKVPKKEDPPDSPVRVIGPPEDIERGKAAVIELLESNLFSKRWHESGYKRGDRVVITGMKSKGAMELNGKQGIITGFEGELEASGRIVVRMSEERLGERCIKLQNLQLPCMNV